MLVDVKTRSYEEKIRFFSFSEFLFYFPQLIAGPIVEPKSLIPQLKKKNLIKLDDIFSGLFIFSIGISIKIFLYKNQQINNNNKRY